MNATGYAFLAVTAIVGALGAVLAFVLLRYLAGARDARRIDVHDRDSATLEAVIEKLKAREQEMAARAEASDRLRTEIVASLLSGLIVVDSAGNLQIVNPAARRILQSEDVADGTDGTLLNDAAALRSVIEESLKTGEPIVRRTVIVERANGPMHLGVTVSPLTAASGAGGAICLFSDLTSVIALEEQLQMKEALARLGELTAGLAHEFRNGLATIHGYARLLEPSALPPLQRPYLEGIREETDSLGKIVTNFLNFAKPDPLVLAPLDLRRLIVQAAEDVATARVTCSGDFGDVDGDEVLLRQALSNLFRNSVEACGAAGVPAVISVTGTIDRPQHTIALTVTDNGPGIQAEALPRLFQPFFTTRAGGTGLGLAIVQKIIVSHNGRISAGNRPEGGAVFHVVLPLPSVRGSLEN